MHIPSKVDSEAICLGAAMSHWHSLELVMRDLQERDFYDERHQIVYGVLKEFYALDNHPKFSDLVRRCQSLGLLAEVGGINYLKNLEVSTRHSEIGPYIRELRDVSQQRELVHLGLALARNELAVPKTMELIGECMGRLGNERSSTVRTLSDVLDNYREGANIAEYFIEKKRQRDSGSTTLGGLPTGWTALDLALDGLGKKELIILGARPGMGKSEVLVQMIASMIKHGLKVYFFSLEMSHENVVARLFGAHSSIHSGRLQRSQFDDSLVAQIEESYRIMREVDDRLWIDATSGINSSQILARATRAVTQWGCDIVIVDHLSKVESDKQSMYEKVTEASAQMKYMAQKLDVPVLVAAQLNRNIASKEDKRPTMADLRDSGAVEQDADKILMVHREDYWDPHNKPGKVDLIIEKNREGDRTTIEFAYDKETQHLKEGWSLPQVEPMDNEEFARLNSHFRGAYDG